MVAKEIESDYGIDKFMEWADNLQYVALCGEIEYDEDEEECDDEWIEWWPVGLCRTEEAAKVLCKEYMEDGTKVKVGTKYDIDWADFLGNLRTDGCVATIDYAPIDDEMEDWAPVDKDWLPLAITTSPSEAIIKLIEDGKMAEAVLEEPNDI